MSAFLSPYRNIQEVEYPLCHYVVGLKCHSKQKRYVRAGYAPVIEAPTESPSSSPVVEDTPEPEAGNEINIKIHCSSNELNTLQTGVWIIGGTDNEKPISNWTKKEISDQEVILSAKCIESEDKTLYHQLFLNSGQSIPYLVTPKETGSEYVNAEFIPAKIAIQIDMNRLAWATKGYFYHFIDGTLNREYKVVGEGKWTYQVTRSDATTLTDELLSEHHYSAVLLPFKVEDSDVPEQHFLYLVDKLKSEELAQIESTWLSEHAMLIDMKNVLASRTGELLYRDSSLKPDPLGPIDQPDFPSPIESFVDVHPHGDIWGWYKQPEFASKAFNIFESKQVSDSSPVINANHMYWPPYDFSKGEDIEVKYTHDVIKFAVLAPEEWQAFFNSIDALRTYKNTATGLYNAVETAKGLGGLGATVLVRKIDGIEYVILKDYDKWSQTLMHGGVFKSSSPTVVKLGLGSLNSVRGMASYVKVSAPLDILVGSAINVLQYIVNDEYTLRSLGVDQTRLLIHVIVVAGLALVGGVVLTGTAATVVGKISILVLSNAIVWGADQWTDFERKLVESTLELLE